MSQALYRKYRSKSLDEVVGQKHVTNILTRALASGHISHAYLLTGPRGVGKTSVARILAHEINGLPYEDDSLNLDIIEIDAASNNGVEDVRDLREKVQIAPVAAKKKVYIIDEVHMLSKAAFNALLKTLEEPPEHIVFILATTNIEKLPDTIISRTQRFSFRPIMTSDAANHLKKIAKAEKIDITDEAIKLIAERGEGSFRDSISLLDQLSSLTDDKITTELIENTIGLASGKAVEGMITAVEKHDLETTVKLLNNLYDQGISANTIAEQLTSKIREDITSKPQLIGLFDSLIEVPKSSKPELKLLSVLGQKASSKQPPKSAALLAPTPEITATVAELKRQVMEDRSEDLVDTIRKKTTKNSSPKFDASNFDWQKLLNQAKQDCVAIYSVLAKCGHEIDGNTLNIYTKTAFYKKKLDEAKYAPLISKYLQEIGAGGLDIHTIPTVLPPRDSQAAAVAVIMGGGEEVSLETL